MAVLSQLASHISWRGREKHGGNEVLSLKTNRYPATYRRREQQAPRRRVVASFTVDERDASESPGVATPATPVNEGVRLGRVRRANIVPSGRLLDDRRRVPGLLTSGILDITAAAWVQHSHPSARCLNGCDTNWGLA